MDYYEDVCGRQLADEFYEELREFFQRVAESPESYAIRERDLRRVNLERLPYHFLFRVASDAVRILVVDPEDVRSRGSKTMCDNPGLGQRIRALYSNRR